MAPREVTESRSYTVFHKTEVEQELYINNFDTYEEALSFAESIEEECVKLAIRTTTERIERFKTSKY